MSGLAVSLPAGPGLQEPVPADASYGQRVRGFLRRRRWLVLWCAGVFAFLVVAGLPTSRPQIFVILGLGLAASGLGADRSWKQLLIDWVPFYALLTLYDALRASAGKWFVPHTTPQLRIDEWLFGGTAPTVTLQHAFYTPGVAHVWDYAAFGIYMTHFFASFVVAALLWKYAHARFRRFAFLFIGLTFAAFITYALYPAVPPWLASQNSALAPTSKIIDEMWLHVGFGNGSNVFSGAGHFGNPVAAMPSLHAAYTMLLVLFFWKSARKWRWLLAIYPLLMALTLVYTGEHYVIDILFGWLYAAVVYFAGSRLLDRWDARKQRPGSGADRDPAPAPEPDPVAPRPVAAPSRVSAGAPEPGAPEPVVAEPRVPEPVSNRDERSFHRATSSGTASRASTARE
jgi:membrane-associated phospholipid phosphatase